MLQITIPATEIWDERTERFVYVKEQTLQLEHSLVSLSKWESKWHKSFLFTSKKTDEEVVDYIKCMTITQNVRPEVYKCLTDANIDAIDAYIRDPMTATTFKSEDNNKRNNEIVTAEIIYYWMSSLGVSMDCQKWHLNRLLTQIRVNSIKSAPTKKMNKKDIMNQNAALNAARRKQLNSKG